MVLPQDVSVIMLINLQAADYPENKQHAHWGMTTPEHLATGKWTNVGLFTSTHVSLHPQSCPAEPTCTSVWAIK